MKIQQAMKQVRETASMLRYYECVDSVMDWDYWNHLPAEARTYAGRVSRFLQGRAQAELLQPQTARLVDWCRDLDPSLLDDDYQRGAVRFLVKSYDDAAKIPSELKEELSDFSRASQAQWLECRKASDWNAFKPNVQKMFSLKAKIAERIDPTRAPYDVLIGETDAGMDSADVGRLFAQLKEGILDVLASRKGCEPVSGSLSAIQPPNEIRKKLTKIAAEATGFDFSKACICERQHPVCNVSGPRDVRLSLNFRLPLFGTVSTLHECGHGMYGYSSNDCAIEWGLWGGVWGGLNESQARFNENMIGKSREFWQYLYPIYCHEIKELQSVDPELFYLWLTAVSPGVNRLSADELTYNLHIIIRFELECDFFAGRLNIDDFEEAWNSKYKECLGVQPANASEGILQDVHWASGHVGYFQSYALGDMYAAQIRSALLTEVPDAFSALSQGDVSKIHHWLEQHIWQYGATYTPGELIVKATGQPLRADCLIDYLKSKYGSPSAFRK